MKIAAIDCYRVSLPLARPYKLSFGAVHSLESVWTRVELDDGAVGWGETTPLPGYSDTTVDDVETFAARLASRWVGKDAAHAAGAVFRGKDGFLFTSVLTALEEAMGAIPFHAGRIPLAGLVQELEGETPVRALQRVRQSGYATFKLKVGFVGIREDALRLEQYQMALLPSEKLRIDANQSLSAAGAARLIAVCDPAKVELFEQPFPPGWWKRCRRLRQISPVPVMLDESILDERTVRKAAAEEAADIVKLKWMKQGGFHRLRHMVQLAEDLGLGVVFGNGVASTLNNAQEARFWLDRLSQSGFAAESNGYLKVARVDGTSVLSFAEGHAVVSESAEEYRRQTEALIHDVIRTSRAICRFTA